MKVRPLCYAAIQISLFFSASRGIGAQVWSMFQLFEATTVQCIYRIWPLPSSASHLCCINYASHLAFTWKPCRSRPVAPAVGKGRAMLRRLCRWGTTGPQLVVGLPCYKGNLRQVLLGHSLVHVCQSTTDLSKKPGPPRGSPRPWRGSSWRLTGAGRAFLP